MEALLGASSSMTLMWAIVLLLVGLALVVMEAFVPSGGILGFLAGTAVVGSIVLAFWNDPIQGVVMLLSALVAIPIVIVLALKYWPSTPIGKRVLLDVPRSEDVLPDYSQRRSLIGKRGVAKATMLPSGPVLIEGRIVDAVSEGIFIEKGQLVEVVEVSGMRIVVRPLTEAEAAQAAQQPSRDEDPLSKPIDTLGLESFDENSGA